MKIFELVNKGVGAYGFGGIPLSEGDLLLIEDDYVHPDTSAQPSVDNSNGIVIQDITLDTYGHVTGLASLDGDSRWARLINAIDTDSAWSHTSLQSGIDFTSYTTGSSGYPSTLGFAVAFYASTADSTSGFGRTFALNRAYNTENYYIGSPNTSGVHNGWRLLYHSGNLSLSTLGGVASTRAVNSGTGLTGGGDLSVDRTLSLTGQALAIHSLNTLGIVIRSAVDTFITRSLAEGTGIGITNPDGIAGNPSIGLVGQALSFHAVSGDGFVYRTSGIVGVRTLTPGAGISITNGNGISGNPVISAISTGSKWAQWNSETSASSFDNILTPNSGSNVFTNAEMAVGKAYVLEFVTDEYGGSGTFTTRHRIKIGGLNYELSIPMGSEDIAFISVKVLMVFESGIDSARLVRFKPIVSQKIRRTINEILGIPKDVISITIDVTSSLTLTYECEQVNSVPVLLYSKCDLIST